MCCNKLRQNYARILKLTWSFSESHYALGLTKFTRFETLYVILLNIHKTLPKQRCSSHFARPKEKKKYYIHFLALALTLTLSLTLTFNHLANEPIQPTIMLFSLMYLTCGNATEHKYLIRCATDYKWLLK